MAVIDYVLLLPLIYGAYLGYKKGFLLMVLGIMAMVVGVGISFNLLTQSIRFLMQYIPHMPEAVPYLAFTLVFILVTIGVYLGGIALKKAMDFTFFAGVIDNLAGAIVGLIQWLFITSTLLWLNFQTFTVIPDYYFKDSVLATHLAYFAPYVVEKSEFLLPFVHDLFTSIAQIFIEL